MLVCNCKSFLIFSIVVDVRDVHLYISQILIFWGTIYCLHCHGLVCVKVRSPSLGLIINLLLFQWVGTECGHHSTYTFYKAVKFANKFATSEEAETLTPQKSSSQSAKETWKVLSLGQFFFVKIWAGSDLLSVAELQLLWEDKVLYCTVLYCTVLYCDKATGQMMSSVRLYLLPEYTAEGRQPHHGEVSHGE